MADAVHFSVTSEAAWAPGVETREAWRAWSRGEASITPGSEPRVSAMPAMQRRRAGLLGKMALEVAYACLDGRSGVPAVFCSRHGEVARSVDMLGDLAAGEPLSPAAFGLSVHNSVAGLFSIARADRANHVALSAGASTVEHGVIEACGLLADGETSVLLVVYDCPLPEVYASFREPGEQPFAWAWLIGAPCGEHFSLRRVRSAADAVGAQHDAGSPSESSGLDILRFFLGGESELRRTVDGQHWHWARHA